MNAAMKAGRLGRREFLAGSALGALAGPVLCAASVGIGTLKDAAAAKGIAYGSDSDIDFDVAPPAYRSLFVAQCALYAPNLPWSELAMKPEGRDLTFGQEGIGFAVDNGLRLTGGHLLWGESLPRDFKTIASRQAAWVAATDRINRLAGRYAGKVYSWNVVNEALEPYDGRADGLARTALLDRLGPDFIETAFQVARSADPKAILAYNDNAFELDIPEHEARRGALLRLLDRLKAANAPIQAVGLQSHLRRFDRGFDEALYRKFLREIAAHGVTIILSELDVNDIGLPSDITARDLAVADMYRRYLDVCLDEPAVRTVVTWGLSDRYTWLIPDSERSFVRHDGLPQRPLPFDADLRPKPAYDALLAAFRGASAR